jgi:hypothetical protein
VHVATSYVTLTQEVTEMQMPQDNAEMLAMQREHRLARKRAAAVREVAARAAKKKETFR